MDFSAVMRLRSLGYDSAIDNACVFFKQGFIATASDPKCGYRFNGYLRTYLKEIEGVARKSGKLESGNASGYEKPLTWVNVSLNNDDTAQIEAWLLGEPDILSDVCHLILSGFAIGCKPAANGDGYMATLTGGSGTESNGLYGLSAYADTPYNAFAALLYKFVSKLDGRLTAAAASSSSRFR